MGNSGLDHALMALEARDWEKAHRMLASLVDSNESVPVEALEALAVCRFKLGLISEACRAMERAFAGFVKEGSNRPARRWRPPAS